MRQCKGNRLPARRAHGLPSWMLSQRVQAASIAALLSSGAEALVVDLDDHLRDVAQDWLENAEFSNALKKLD